MAKHERTLSAIFAEPTRANIDWAAIEALFVHLGARIREGSGSRVRVKLNGADAVFHRPHPGKETKKPGIRSVRTFLTVAGHAP